MRSKGWIIGVALLLIMCSYLLTFYKHGNITPTAEPERRGESFLHPRQNTKNNAIMFGIQLTEGRGYTEFTATVLREYHQIDSHDIHVYTSSKIGHTQSQLNQWYGANIVTTSLEPVSSLKTILQEFVSQRAYTTLFLIDSNMVFLSSWRDFILRHMVNIRKPFHFLSLYHSANMHDFINDCDNLTGIGLCEGPLQTKQGVALSKQLAEKILLKHLVLLEHYNWDEILRKENLPSLYPRKSLVMNIGQSFQGEDFCGVTSVPYGFNVCQLPVWIRDGIELYFDRCTNAQEKYLPGISIKQANSENRLWTRPAISFCLYGSSTRYTNGALENSKRAYSIYPGWKLWIYLDNSVPDIVVHQLCEQNVRFVNMTGTDIVNKMSWRSLVAGEPVPMYAIRDIDSRLLSRGKTAVDEWIKSGRKFHVMRDHPNHSRYSMSGGMWGGRVPIQDMRNLIKKYRGGNGYLTDMNFLGRVVWGIVKKSVWVHDSHSLHKFGEDHPFSTPWEGVNFVGNVHFS